MIHRVSKECGRESGVKQNEGNVVKKGVYVQHPENYCSWDIFGFFLQNYGFTTTLSNSVYKTTLRFFDVLDSFLMLF